MPNFKSPKWNNNTIKVRPPETDFLRSADLLHLIPYFWDTDISLDLMIQPSNPKSLKIEEEWEYRWELRNLDDEIIKNGIGTINMNPKQVKRNFWARKIRAIKLGYLKPGQQYVLYLYLIAGQFGRSEPLKMVTYTIKDRDEYYIQLLILIIGIGFAFILWALGGR